VPAEEVTLGEEVAPADDVAPGDDVIAAEPDGDAIEPEALVAGDAELVPRAAGDPLAPPVLVLVGAQDMAASRSVAITMVLMRVTKARTVPLSPAQPVHRVSVC